MTTLLFLDRIWTWDLIAVAIASAAVTVFALSRPTLPRVVAFGAAVVAFMLALSSPIATLADGYLFSAHMLQHLLLVLVVPPLVLLALPARTGARPRRLPALAAWGLGVGAMWLWHAPALCNAAATNGLVHRVQEASLLAMGVGFWWPVLARDPARRLSPLSSVIYLFTACIACTILGIAVALSPVQVCSVYVHPVDPLGILPVLRGDLGLTVERDQQLGGLLMWVPACVVYLVAILASLRRFYREAPAAEVT